MASAHFSIFAAPPPTIRVHHPHSFPMPRLPSKAGPSSPSIADDVGAAAPAHDIEARKKKHLCQTCNRGFTTSGHLSRHQRVHTGERNHACPFPGCNTRCSRQDNLQQHYRVHLSARSRNISTSAARQAMARRQSEAGGVINTGSITPPPMPADQDRGSPPAPASLAYRSQQYSNGARSPESPPHPAAIAAAVSGPVGALQPINTSTAPYPSYLPRPDHPLPSRMSSAVWNSGQYVSERSRNDYDNQPLSPASASSGHSHSPITHLHPDIPQPRSSQAPHAHNHHGRQYSTSSAGSLQDGSGSDVSAPSFMEPAFDPGATTSNYQSLPNPTYLHHHQPSQHPSSSARVQSPPPILPPIFTNSHARNSLGGHAHGGSQNNGSHHYTSSHAHGGSA